jgi:hypothetical protein
MHFSYEQDIKNIDTDICRLDLKKYIKRKVKAICIVNHGLRSNEEHRKYKNKKSVSTLYQYFILASYYEFISRVHRGSNLITNHPKKVLEL